MRIWRRFSAKTDEARDRLILISRRRRSFWTRRTPGGDQAVRAQCCDQDYRRFVATTTVAQDYFWQELPFLVYRTHENPDTEKDSQAGNVYQYWLFYSYRADEVHPKRTQKLLLRLTGRRGGVNQPADTPLDEAGKVQHRKHRAFRTGNFG